MTLTSRNARHCWPPWTRSNTTKCIDQCPIASYLSFYVPLGAENRHTYRDTSIPAAETSKVLFNSTCKQLLSTRSSAPPPTTQPRSSLFNVDRHSSIKPARRVTRFISFHAVVRIYSRSFFAFHRDVRTASASLVNSVFDRRSRLSRAKGKSIVHRSRRN